MCYQESVSTTVSAGRNSFTRSLFSPLHSRRHLALLPASDTLCLFEVEPRSPTPCPAVYHTPYRFTVSPLCLRCVLMVNAPASHFYCTWSLIQLTRLVLLNVCTLTTQGSQLRTRLAFRTGIQECMVQYLERYSLRLRTMVLTKT